MLCGDWVVGFCFEIEAEASEQVLPLHQRVYSVVHMADHELFLHCVLLDHNAEIRFHICGSDNPCDFAEFDLRVYLYPYLHQGLLQPVCEEYSGKFRKRSDTVSPGVHSEEEARHDG